MNKSNHPRSQSVDIFKTIAVFGVIAIHLSPSTSGGERLSAFFVAFVVPFFLIISLYYSFVKLKSLKSPCLGDFRFDRLLIPYCAWTIIYILLRLVKYQFAGKTFTGDIFSIVFYGGAAVHLYFIPLLLFFQISLLSLAFIYNSPRNKLFFCISLFIALAYGFLGAVRNYFGFTNLLQLGLIYILCAWLLFRLQFSVIGRFSNILAGVLIVSYATALFLDLVPRASGIWIAPLMGYGFSAIALNIPLRLTGRFFAIVLSFSFGIYLSHFLFIEFFEFILPKLGFAIAPYSFIEKLSGAVIVMIVSSFFVLLVRASNPIAAYVLFGEGTPSDLQNS
jgi:hypothetical protein